MNPAERKPIPSEGHKAVINPEGEKDFAVEYMTAINSQGEIIKDARDLLTVIKHSPLLKPEAVAKVVNVQMKRIADAEAEIRRIQKENEATITAHMKREDPARPSAGN